MIIALVLNWLISPNENVRFFFSSFLWYVFYEALWFNFIIKPPTTPFWVKVYLALSEYNFRQIDRSAKLYAG